ncbi:hypothetical protein D3C81_1084580 [compost metagenome]
MDGILPDYNLRDVPQAIGDVVAAQTFKLKQLVILNGFLFSVAALRLEFIAAGPHAACQTAGYDILVGNRDLGCV